MMTNLKQAISSVLETMFFLPVQIIEESSLWDNWSQQKTQVWHVAVGFSGPVNGSFFLLVPASLAQEITANFLGLDEAEVVPSQESDTVKEALNMIGGYVLSEVDQADEFQIGIPEVVSDGQTDLANLQLEPHHTIIIETEDNNLAVGLRLE
jgi:CheY-specific phosphatase CheX